MFGLRQALVFSSLFLSAWTSPAHHRQDRSVIDWDEFQALLDQVDSAAIHAVLHSLSPKFQDGVFSKDRSAIEQVHSESPALASKLVYMAKRQASNSTAATSSTSATPSTSSESSAAGSSTSATPSTPSQSSAAAESSSVAASVSSVLSSAIAASTVPPPTTVLVAPTTPNSATPIATTDGAVVFSTYGGGLVTLTSSAESVHFTPSTSTHLYYTTLGNGKVQTSTDVIVVNAPITGGGNALTPSGTASAAAASSSSPSLQNGAERVSSGFLAEAGLILGGAVAVALAL